MDQLTRRIKGDLAYLISLFNGCYFIELMYRCKIDVLLHIMKISKGFHRDLQPNIIRYQSKMSSNRPDAGH